MGRGWDTTDIANNVEVWKECLRVLKPGGYLLSFGGTRTYHKMACAVEDAGFEIRDMIEWVYGSGFPKNYNIGKAVDKLQDNKRIEYVRSNGKATNSGSGCYHMNDGKSGSMKKIFKDSKGNSEWEGWGTALKPSHEPIAMARKPLSEKTIVKNCLKWGTGGINIDECRIEHNEPEILTNRKKDMGQSWNKDNTGLRNNPTNIASANPQGRFPANLIHDGSNEVLEIFPNSKAGKYKGYGSKSGGIWNKSTGKPAGREYGDLGSAARFFYCAKSSKTERNKGCEELEEKVKVWDGQSDKSSKNMRPESVEERWTSKAKNCHPTVKPLALMEYLIKLVSREDTLVLDLFAGSGTTLMACKKLKRNFIGIELREEYCKIAHKRLEKIRSNK